MKNNKTSLEVGDVLYKLRHQVGEERLVIDRVSDQLAFSGKEYSFVRNDIEVLIIRVSSKTGYRTLFGESYVLETPENKQKLDRDIKLRFIRNFQYSQLSDTQLDELKKILNIYIHGNIQTKLDSQ